MLAYFAKTFVLLGLSSRVSKSQQLTARRKFSTSHQQRSKERTS